MVTDIFDLIMARYEIIDKERLEKLILICINNKYYRLGLLSRKKYHNLVVLTYSPCL